MCVCGICDGEQRTEAAGLMAFFDCDALVLLCRWMEECDKEQERGCLLFMLKKCCAQSKIGANPRKSHKYALT